MCGKQIWSYVVRAAASVGFVVAVGVAFSLASAQPAAADWVKSGYGVYDIDGDGVDDYYEEYTDSESGDSMMWFELDDGWYIVGNPGPDDAGTEPPDREAAIDLAKQKGSEVVYEVEFGQSAVGQALEAQGDGASPVWNPADDAGDGTGNPMSGIVEQVVLDMSGVETPEKEIDGDAGSPASQIVNGGGGGGGDVITDNSGTDHGIVDSADEKPGLEWWEAEPVAPKVNPPTVKK